MKIKKLEFQIGSYFGDNFSLNYKKGIFEYRAAVDRIVMTELNPVFKNDYHFEHVAIFTLDSIDADLVISEERKHNFYNYISRYCNSWEKDYPDDEVMDGTSWNCTIWIDDFKLNSSGHMSYPSNFNSFLNKLTELTSGKIFKK